MNSWSENKRQANIQKHGIDFADLDEVFDSPMVTRQDDRAEYGEDRYQSLFILHGRVAVLAWADYGDDRPRLISCRYGDKHETMRFFQAFN